MSIFSKFLDWTDRKRMENIKEETAKYVSKPLFQEHLDVAKDAVDAFIASKKEPKDIQDFFVVLHASIQYCCSCAWDRDSEFLKESVQNEMYKRICKLILPEGIK